VDLAERQPGYGPESCNNSDRRWNKINIWRARLGLGLQKSIATALFLLMWELLPRFHAVDPFYLPPFSKVLEALWALTVSGEVFKHVGISLQRAFTGFIIAIIFSIPLGIIMGWFQKFESIVDPLLQIFRNTSALALFPVFILIFGLGEISKTAIILWGAIWPTLLNTIGGVKSVEPLLIKSARSMGISQFNLFRKVILPAATPSILTGLRLSATHSVLVLVAAEMLGANAGLGFLIFYSEQKYAIPEMYVGIISISLLGFAVNYLLVALEKRFTRWKEQYHNY